MFTKALTLILLVAAASGLSLLAQAPSTNADQQVHANLNQLMRGAFNKAPENRCK